MASISSARVTTTVAQNPATPVSSTVPTTSARTSSAVVVTTSSVIPTTSSVVTTSSVLPTTSTTSSKPTTTSIVTPTTTSTTPTSTRPVITITSTSSVPLLTTSSVSSTSSASLASGNNSSTGVGGSGLSVGALAGIIAGGVVVLIAIAVVATRSIRKKQRERRTRRRSAMMEPWGTGMDDDPTWEKPRYEAPSQSFAMQDQYPAAHYSNEPTYPQIDDPYIAPTYAEQHNPQAGYQVGSSQGHEYAAAYPGQEYGAVAGNAGVGAGGGGYQEYPVEPVNVYPDAPVETLAGVGAGGAGAAAVGSAVAPQGGLRDGSMVRVKVGFVRSLEDELAITPGQQLYLHSMYDDGWSLCEDQQANRGVVPLSCLEPWQDHLGPVANEETSASERVQRRSSLFQNAQAAGAYLNMSHQ